MKFCIVTPSYNQAQFLEHTIESVLYQKGDFTIELFVADGGSTDGSLKILKKYFKYIKFISEKDGGQTDAINKGITYFSKQHNFNPKDAIFAYINSDDFYMPNAFSQVVAALKQHPELDWVVGDAVIVDEDGLETQKPIRVYKRFWRKLFSAFTLGVMNPIPQPSTFIRWTALQDVGSFNKQLRYVMDYEYWLRLLASGRKPLFISSALSSFRIHGASKGGSQFNKQFAEELQVACQYVSNFLVIALHTFHNRIIVIMYGILK